MQKIVIIVFIVSLLAILLLAKTKSQSRKKANRLPALSELTNITRRDPLTKREQEMYLALTSALPGCVVLAQMALSALITTTSQATRNRFDRKVADFIICSKQLAVITVIELDDASHKTKTAQDADRDVLLANAGYKTIRYPNVPDQNTIRKDVAALIFAANNHIKRETN